MRAMNISRFDPLIFCSSTGIYINIHRRILGEGLKNTQNVIAESHPDGTQTVRFTPLAPYETPGAIDSICDNFNQAIDACIVDSLVLIPIFINDFLCIHPFNDGNGRMSRLLTTLLLYRCGYVVGRYISLESKIEKPRKITTMYWNSAGMAGTRMKMIRHHL